MLLAIFVHDHCAERAWLLRNSLAAFARYERQAEVKIPPECDYLAARAIVGVSAVLAPHIGQQPAENAVS